MDYKMDTMTKNETKTDSQRIQTFRITFDNLTADTQTLRRRGIEAGIYISMSDSALLKQAMIFLRKKVVAFSSLPNIPGEVSETVKQIKVWNAVIANPTLDSKQIQEIVGVGTTERVSISWLGSVVEFLSSVEAYKEAAKGFLSAHKCLSERTHGGRTPNPENRAKRDAKAQERAVSILNNYSLEQLNKILEPRMLYVAEYKPTPAPQPMESSAPMEPAIVESAPAPAPAPATGKRSRSRR